MKNLRFSVKSRRHGSLEILQGINAYVRSGEVLAIMGGSGAGKTTLLDTLVLANTGGHRSGAVTLNGRPLDGKMFRASCAYVAQHDVQNPALTVRETMDFAAALYRSREELPSRKACVDTLLEQTGLVSCQSVFVGGEFIKGISGGQRRRLSVAVELIKRPSLLVLDEPTSGLDSAAAEAIMDLLAQISRCNNVAVVCTIHQPSSYLYHSFQQLLLLAKGRVCYFGAAEDALDHFARIGFPSPQGVNPAEFLIRITNPDFCSEEQVSRICDAWLCDSSSWALDSGNVSSAPSSESSFASTQLRHLFYRSLKGNTRNPAAFIGRLIMSSFMVAFVSVAYSGARNRTQEEVLDRMWVCMWIQQLPAFFCVGAVPSFARESLCFRKEVKNGLYSPGSYFLADCLVNVPFWFILSFVSILPAFVILDLNWKHFHCIWFLTGVFAGFCDTVAQLCGTAFRSTTVGVMAFVGQTIMCMIFNGTLLTRIDSVTWALRWIFYIVPSKYSFRSAMRLEFDGLMFDGFDHCLDPRISPMQRATMTCWGETGNQIVSSLSKSMFPVLTTEETLGLDLAIIAGELLLLKLIHVVLLYAASR
eukprot:TRINITY_DN4611_c0_g2_i2.p1 TRINITY_DN4611_c0_g2~~TRINITY_DN4611_c0_g2_i2.p1  ORF type:complete len:663 (+),score=36.44 TRINITY_DN4611_c0_g2_i2:223-1989(+)